ncbi:MAG: dihydrofolate reductase [Betaproteobacteria bacterium]|nr:dihydrofolate reductase [Betaproteobacteria bacterium]
MRGEGGEGREEKQPRVSIIVAMDRGRVIGKDNRLPWHISEDLKRFKALTMGHPIIMGRKTFESIGRVLPGRENIVVTRKASYAVPAGVKTANSLEAAIALASGEEEVFVIGGREIYDQALPMAHRLHVTLVEGHFEGDTHFPSIDASLWREIAREQRSLCGEGYDGYAFVTYMRHG